MSLISIEGFSLSNSRLATKQIHLTLDECDGSQASVEAGESE